MASLQNMPIGAVILWKNAEIPANWAVCDGVSAPDYVGYFPIGIGADEDLGSTSGSSTNHTHTTPDASLRAAHNHGGELDISISTTTKQTYTSSGSTTTFGKDASHGHSRNSGGLLSSEDEHSHTLSDTGEASHMPIRVKRVLIKKIS